MRNCQQIKCGYLGSPFCPVCLECKAEPNVIDDNCTKCWNCEHDENELRGRIPQEPQRERGVIIIRA